MYNEPVAKETGPVHTRYRGRPRMLVSRDVLLAAVATGLSLFAFGCRGVDNRAETAYLERNYAESIERFHERSDNEVMGFALSNLELASVCLEDRRFREAEQALSLAARVSDDLPGDLPEEVSAAKRRQAGFLYVGAPHERVLNALYRCLTALMRRDPITARLALQPLGSILDQSGVARSEFPLGSILLGLAASSAGDDVSAAAALAELETDEPLRQMIRNANVVVWIDTNFGPAKRIGEGGTPPTYVTRESLATRLSVEIDGQRALPPTEWVNVSQLAQRMNRRRDSTDADAGDELVGGFINLINRSLQLFTVWAQAPQETRQWSLLPGQVQLWMGRLDPGVHEILVRARSRQGVDLGADHRVHRFTADSNLTVIYLRFSPRSKTQRLPETVE